MCTRGLKVVSRLWNQFQTSGTVTRKVIQGCRRASTFAHDRYLALSARQHRWTTAAQFNRDLFAVTGRRISRKTVYSRLAETVLHARRLVLCVHLAASNRKDKILGS
ncbi:hypothetical protein TNCV_4675571 [Trichonephila clavipes]|nr:hypothetical protein TNCV_4675571 [Trichonephila clavipes]